MISRLNEFPPLLGSQAGDYSRFPHLRYMGSKARLLPWIATTLGELEFDSALDAFAGSGCVAYLLKSMGKRVIANDFLNFSCQIATATVENARDTISEEECDRLVQRNHRGQKFIEQTFSGIFYTPEDLALLDTVWSNLSRIRSRYKKALAIAALVRACVKRQPRGVFTVAGACEHYDDGRRDLRISLEQQFRECVKAYNDVIFDNGRKNRATRADALSARFPRVDLVYMDPPYVPRSDDNCYIKRYHFLEGLSSYWRDTGTTIDESTKVKKIPKRFTPFSYRRTAVQAFDQLFRRFKSSTLVLSYSSNGYPDLDLLVAMMGRYKANVEVVQRAHRYHFGNHSGVSEDRATVKEFLVVGT